MSASSKPGTPPDASQAALRVAMRFVALHEDEPCGDAGGCFDLGASTLSGDRGWLLAIIDGLGHGPMAALAAAAATRLIGEHAALPLPQLLTRLDTGLVDTRGAALGLARIDWQPNGWRLQHAGIGNTRALRWRGAELMRLSSQAGIVGGGDLPPVRVAEIDLQGGDWLLLFTDGIDEMLQLPAHLPEWQRDPALLCEHLLARWRPPRQPRDDAGVLVCHLEPALGAA